MKLAVSSTWNMIDLSFCFRTIGLCKGQFYISKLAGRQFEHAMCHILVRIGQEQKLKSLKNKTIIKLATKRTICMLFVNFVLTRQVLIKTSTFKRMGEAQYQVPFCGKSSKEGMLKVKLVLLECIQLCKEKNQISFKPCESLPIYVMNIMVFCLSILRRPMSIKARFRVKRVMRQHLSLSVKRYHFCFT